MTDQPFISRLFDPVKTDPLELVRRRDETGQFWQARCTRCHAVLAWAHGQDEARRAGLEGLGGHRCVGPGELPDSF